MGTQQKDTKVTTMGTTKNGQQWGKPLRGDGSAAYHNPRWAYGRPGAMQGKPLRGRTATAHDYTTDTHIASPRINKHAPPNHTPLPPTRLPPHCSRPLLGCDVSRVTIAPKGDSVTPNGVIIAHSVISYLERQKHHLQPICSALMGCSDAGTRHLPVIVTHRKATHMYNITTHNYPTRLHPESPPTNSSPHQFASTPIHLHPNMRQL
jgi:hypothetical protein